MGEGTHRNRKKAFMVKSEIGKAILVGVVGIGCLVMSGDVGAAWGILFLLVGIYLCVWAGFLSYDQVYFRILYRREHAHEIETRTVAVRKIEAVARLSAQQIEALGGGMVVEAMGGSAGPTLQVRMLNDEMVQLEFVYEFLRASNEVELLPIRMATQRLGQFGNARRQAELLTAYLQYHGFAVAGAGPNQAAWVDDGYNRACVWCGYGSIQLGSRLDEDGCQVPERQVRISRGFRRTVEAEE